MATTSNRKPIPWCFPLPNTKLKNIVTVNPRPLLPNGGQGSYDHFQSPSPTLGKGFLSSCFMELMSGVTSFLESHHLNCVVKESPMVAGALGIKCSNQSTGAIAPRKGEAGQRKGAIAHCPRAPGSDNGLKPGSNPPPNPPETPQ